MAQYNYKNRSMSPREKKEAAIILALSIVLFGTLVKYRPAKTVPALPANKTLTD